jgi:pyruvate dehydrogenase E1 component alpha subunit
MNHQTKESLIAFETRIKEMWEAGDLPYLIHLCGGNEETLVEIFREVRPGDWIFSSHRNHYHALLSGMDPLHLENLIRGGHSMFVYGAKDDEQCDGRHKMPVNFLTSSVLAGMCCIAAGVALRIEEQGRLEPPSPDQSARLPHVWCFIGDGGEDEGHFYEAVRFVDGHKLPCTFILEDNDRSVDTNRHQRRGESRMAWPQCVRKYHYTPTYPHAGSGCKHHIKFKVLARP